MAEASSKLRNKRENRDKQGKTTDDLKYVIDGAKLECKICKVPIGKMKVNLDTPKTQGKRTATVAENSSKSLVFDAPCKKSPKSAVPCKKVMKLDKWKNVGSIKVQDHDPLLKKSTIKCLYGGATIKIVDSGQRQEGSPSSNPPDGAPIPDSKSMEKIASSSATMPDAGGMGGALSGAASAASGAISSVTGAVSSTVSGAEGAIGGAIGGNPISGVITGIAGPISVMGNASSKDGNPLTRVIPGIAGPISGMGNTPAKESNPIAGVTPGIAGPISGTSNIPKSEDDATIEDSDAAVDKNNKKKPPFGE
jgi:hypothetical protein